MKKEIESEREIGRGSNKDVKKIKDIFDLEFEGNNLINVFLNENVSFIDTQLGVDYDIPMFEMGLMLMSDENNRNINKLIKDQMTYLIRRQKPLIIGIESPIESNIDCVALWLASLWLRIMKKETNLDITVEFVFDELLIGDILKDLPENGVCCFNYSIGSIETLQNIQNICETIRYSHKSLILCTSNSENLPNVELMFRPNERFSNGQNIIFKTAVFQHNPYMINPKEYNLMGILNCALNEIDQCLLQKARLQFMGAIKQAESRTEIYGNSRE